MNTRFFFSLPASLLLVASPLSFQIAAAQENGVIPTPSPSSPPPFPRTDQGKAAIERAISCVNYPERSGFVNRAEADNATRNLTASPGSKEWNSSRISVVSYMKGRQASLACINALKDQAKPGNSDSGDRAAMILNADTLRNFWLEQSQYEITILARMINTNTSN